jgi:hypothetical protein
MRAFCNLEAIEGEVHEIWIGLEMGWLQHLRRLTRPSSRSSSRKANRATKSAAHGRRRRVGDTRRIGPSDHSNRRIVGAGPAEHAILTLPDDDFGDDEPADMRDTISSQVTAPEPQFVEVAGEADDVPTTGPAVTASGLWRAGASKFGQSRGLAAPSCAARRGL